MRQAISRTSIATFLLLSAAASASADICVNIDEPRDTLSLQDRAAALLLVTREFESAGEHVASDACTAFYTIAHVQLGTVIIVTLSGPAGQREGRAQGIDDLPALYNQMVRSMITGRPMGSINVIDRTNVTQAQAEPRRVEADSFSYARLGYGGTFAGGVHGAPTMGFGYRAELDSFAVDVSFLNYQIRSSGSYASGAYGSDSGMSGSILKLEGLYFLKPAANASPYVGGGLSWGATTTSRKTGTVYSSTNGSGLQGELTAGYELPRASTVRIFAQADAIFPFYRSTAETITYTHVPPYSTQSTGVSRYTPSLSASIGVGWQRHRR